MSFDRQGWSRSLHGAIVIAVDPQAVSHLGGPLGAQLQGRLAAKLFAVSARLARLLI